MGTVANKDDDGEAGRGPSESSGLSDIMEIAASLGIDEHEGEGTDAEEVDDDLHNLAAGYGGSAAAALVADATVEPPAPVKAANAPKSDPKIPVAAPEAAKPPPPPPAKSSASSAAISKASLAVAPPPIPAARAAASSAAIPVPSASTSTAARVPVTPAAARAPAPPAKSNKGVWIVAALALVAIGGGAAWMMVRDANRGSETQVVSAEVTPAPAPEPEPEPPKPEPVAVAPVPVAPPPVEEPVPEPVVEEPVAPAAEEVQATVTKRKGKKAGAGAAEEIVEEEEEKSSPFEDKDDGKFSAECLLDPSKPGCEELLRKRRGGKGTNLDATLADKLSKTQIREGFASVKGKAKACGGAPGTTVRVKVSISGDGDVISAEPLSPHDGGDPVGECVANALKDAKFDRFTSAQQGTTYPVQF